MLLLCTDTKKYELARVLCDCRVKGTYHNMQKSGFTASSHVETEAVAGRNVLTHPEVTRVCSRSKKASGGCTDVDTRGHCGTTTAPSLLTCKQTSREDATGEG